ncbi:protein kinase [Glaciecola sp. SC05]|uniref:protein kinase domain-containing protein n=1 Tax=Glaciecola sp. SC05 TaxID=1987355 RepID=UPI003526F941
MLDWAKISAEVEHALSLDNTALTSFIASLPTTKEANEVSRLIKRLRPATGFMATSAIDHPVDEAKLADGTLIDAWKIDQHIGRGGMGDVYRAHRADGLYEQTVALKLIQSPSGSRSELFEIERQRLAHMDHHGIARIIDGGSYIDGRPYMAMEYIQGEPIVQHAVNNKLALKQRLIMFLAVCEAVDYAHSKLVLHRDIKSENVLIAADGSPRLIDFGIATDINDAKDIPAALTLASAAPEQLLGESVSIQTDVFSLGVLLHELIADKRPSRLSNGGMQADDSKITEKDLLAIVSKALLFAPAQRYASALSFSQDVKAFLEKRPVSARNGNWAYRAQRFIQRYPIANTLAVTAVLALLVGMATSLKFASDANHQASLAKLALEKANWQFERTEATLAAQQAYSDVLQRAFGGEEDVERLSQLLKARWQEAFSRRNEDEKTAAALSYAIGRNFYFRGDTASALEIFDPWMAEQIGSESLVALGEEVYAMMLSDAGRYDESTKILRRLVAFFGDGSQTNDADASNYANRLARATRAPEDIARSVTLLNIRLQNVHTPFERLFSYSQLAGMRALQGSFNEALHAYEQTLRIFDENPGFATYGRDIARFNLASIVLAWKGDTQRASALVDAILTEDVPLKGESIQQARATMLKAIILVHQGDPQSAIILIEESVSLFKRFAGEKNALFLLAKGIHAYILFYANQTDLAMAKIAQAQSEAAMLPANERIQKQLKLISVSLKSAQGSLELQELAWLKDSHVHNEAASNLIILYLYKKLADKQLAPEFWLN